jgi:hypothetical protein
VAVHAVSIAVELGDAGQAIELGQQVNPGILSLERQARPAPYVQTVAS